MAAASATQLAQWASAAGFVGEDQAVAVAIALATGADPAAPTGAWGLGGGGDGGSQAQAAYARFQASGWGTFAAHSTGHYLMYMPTAEAVVTKPGAAADSGTSLLDPLGIWHKVGEGISNAADQNVPVVSDVVGAIKFIENPNTWKRGTMLVAGVLLLGIAFVKFGWDNVVTMPLRVLDNAGDEVAHRAQVVGLFTHPQLRTPGGQMSQVGQRQASERAAAAGARTGVRQETRRQEARAAAAPRPAGRHAKPTESPKVAQARAAARAAGDERNREYRERKARGEE